MNKLTIMNNGPFPVTNLPAYLINSEQIGNSEEFCNVIKVPFTKLFDCNTEGSLNAGLGIY